MRVNQDDTSGDYKRTLLNLCGGDDEYVLASLQTADITSRGC